MCTHGTLHEEGIEQHIPGTETVASRAGIQKVRRVIRHEVGLEGRGHISQGLYFNIKRKHVKGYT